MIDQTVLLTIDGHHALMTVVQAEALRAAGHLVGDDKTSLTLAEINAFVEQRRDISTCDFCSAPPPVTWRFPCSDFGQLGADSTGAWVACERCASLINAGDRRGLVEVATDGYARRDPATSRSVLRVGVALAHDGFWKHRTGDGERIEVAS